MQAIACLQEERAAALAETAEQERIEELRLRSGGAPSVRIDGEERQLELAPVTADELRETVGRAARYSVHSYAESMRQGFLPLEGGHRLGLCGTAVAENGSVTGVRRISSLNLRVARQIDALDDILEPYIGEGAPFSLLVLAPPGCGKTTLVREWVRLVSDAGHTAAIADERGEIAGLAEGVPQFRVGRCTDILEGCTKKQAALMLLKTMSPALLAKNENVVVRQIFSGVRRRMRERSDLSLSYLWCAGMRAAQADAGLGREECGVLCDAANFLGRYDVSEQKAAIDTALHRLQMLRELAFAELRDRGSLYRTCGIAAGLLVILVLV